MKEKRLNRVAKKLEKERQKLISLIPKHIQKDFEEESYIAGGSVYSLYNKKKVNDIDIFIESVGVKNDLLAYFKNVDGLSIKSSYGEFIYVGKYKGKKLVITKNAITIGKYQIILKDIGKPEEVVGRFDYKHNMHYLKDGNIFTASDTYNLELMQLVYNDRRARDIASCIQRIPKMYKKGLTITPSELGKMVLELNEKGLSEDEEFRLKNKKNIHFGSGS